jgi:small-conductance mechanosensitive channel
MCTKLIHICGRIFEVSKNINPHTWTKLIHICGRIFWTSILNLHTCVLSLSTYVDEFLKKLKKISTHMWISLVHICGWICFVHICVRVFLNYGFELTHVCTKFRTHVCISKKMRIYVRNFTHISERIFTHMCVKIDSLKRNKNMHYCVKV